MGKTLNGSTNNSDGRYVLGIDFLLQRHGDCVSDKTMQEIIERLIVYARGDLGSDIIRSEDMPQDKTKLWYKPSTKELFIWSETDVKWILTDVENNSGCVSASTGNFIKRDESGCLICALSSDENNVAELDESGNPLVDKTKLGGFAESQELTFTTSGSGTASQTLGLGLFSDDSANINVIFGVDPTATARWWVTAQTESGFTLNFAGLANSTSYTVRVVATKVK